MLGDRSDDVENAAAALSQESGNARVVGARCDVTDEDEVEALVASVVDRFGALDLLVVNAGVGGGADHLTELSTEAFDTVIGVNLRGAFLSVRAAAKVMRLQGSGSIVTVSSVYARVPVEGSAAYSASKAGLIAMTKTAALEPAPIGITVNAHSARIHRHSHALGCCQEPREARRNNSRGSLCRRRRIGSAGALWYGRRCGRGGGVLRG